jgi:hypothetical protein
VPSVDVIVTPPRYRRGSPDDFGARLTVFGKERVLTITMLQPPCNTTEQRRDALALIVRLQREVPPYKRTTVAVTANELRAVLDSYKGWETLSYQCG